MPSAMEQTKYLMWSRRNIGSRPPPLFGSPVSMVAAGSTYHESWEEQAFAEDSSGLLGGCVWPPRSYSCSFCRREFRSAQALGGHMNVHRRDRARLKQSSSPTREIPEQYPTQISTPECYSTNPNPNSGVGQYTLVTPSCPPPPPPPPPPLTLDEQQQIDSSFFPIRRSSTNPLPARLLSTIPDLNLGMDNWKSKEMGRTNLGKRGYQEQINDVDEMVICNKRRRFDPLVSPSIVKPTEVLELGSSPPVEELDLELRLGDSPKVT